MGAEGDSRQITQGELINRENLAKSVIACAEIPSKKITRDMLTIRSPGQD